MAVYPDTEGHVPLSPTWRIWKHELTHGIFPLMLTRGAEIVLIGLDPDRSACLWEKHRVDMELKPETRHFLVVGTGHQFMTGFVHRGSWVEGPFVWHLFELVP